MKQKPRIAFRIQHFIYLFLGSLFMLAIGCQQGPPKNSRAAQAMAGKEIFKKECASCHGGVNMEIDRARVDTLMLTPPDLTKINQRWRVREFPIAEIARIIDGRRWTKAHGSRDMPVWGQIFADDGMDEGEIKGKKGELIAYLMSIQTGD